VIKHLFLTVLGMSSMYVSAMEADASHSNHKYSPLHNQGYEELDALELYKLGYATYTAGTSSLEHKKQNLIAAREYLTKAVAQGEKEAAILLGRMWQYGEGGDKNIDKAEKLYLLAHQRGALGGTEQLAAFYYNTNQLKKSLNLYLPLAHQGNPKAQLAVGNMYLNGFTQKDYKIDPNFETALEWYKKAAAQGDLTAVFSVGRTYYLLKDYKEALIHLKEICQNDQAEKLIGRNLLGQAKSALANIYGIKGYGDKAEAIQLYKEAIALGNTQAVDQLKALNRMPGKVNGRS
jgi:TPR repeat protein